MKVTRANNYQVANKNQNPNFGVYKIFPSVNGFAVQLFVEKFYPSAEVLIGCQSRIVKTKQDILAEAEFARKLGGSQLDKLEAFKEYLIETAPMLFPETVAKFTKSELRELVTTTGTKIEAFKQKFNADTKAKIAKLEASLFPEA